jgi:hypothetical protein
MKNLIMAKYNMKRRKKKRTTKEHEHKKNKTILITLKYTVLMTMNKLEKKTKKKGKETLI